MGETNMEGPVAILRSWSVHTVAAVVFVYVLLKVFRRVRHKSGRRPPGPPSLPLIGHLYHLTQGLPHHTLAKMAEKYGSIMWLDVGALSVVVVSSPDMAREILKTQDHIFASRPSGLTIEYVFGQGQDLLFCPLNDHLRRVRKFFSSQLLSLQRIDSFKDLRRDTLFKTMAKAYEEGHANRYINFSDVMHELFITTTTAMVFRRGAGAHIQDFTEILMEMSNSEWFSIGDIFPLLKPLDLDGQVKRLKMAGEKSSKLMDSIIDNRLKEKTKSMSYEEEDFLDVLLTTSGFTRDQVKYLILDIVAAGTDTTSGTIVWGMTELLRHPNIMERLQSELDDVIGKERMVEEADLRNLEYLQAVVKETLRLHPPAMLGVPHSSTEATKVAGYDIPANTWVIVNIHAISTDPKVWENPLKFDPSRFLNSRIDVRGQHYEVLPFSSGRRLCPGMNLGLVSVAYTLAQLVHACSISLPEGLTPLDVDVEETFGLTVRKRNPLNLLLTRRLPSDVYHKAGLNGIGQSRIPVDT
ncbi:hypothetical protein AXG93_1939s1020 [Marchantia polymorpha subsp. ruderalis]|uniref:Cytochrome P450 n=1 Tax=Marchantia polymorpha subsp. ruderalis TaxID=1480154 RepID=A0A176VY18_MARPO|nr:hypothetical protein AXG93_1939s1020 [Marchantia polymorpha subsp. ruderalis]